MNAEPLKNVKIALINFTHTSNNVGGVETRYRLLERALVSVGYTPTLFATCVNTYEELLIATDDSALAISDSAVCLETTCPMITVFGNPWRAVLEVMPDDERMNYIAARERRWHANHPTVRVAVSQFMRSEMEAAGIKADHVISNPADLERFASVPEKTSPPTILWCGSMAPIKQYEVAENIRNLWDDRYPDLPARWNFALKQTNELSYEAMTLAYLEASVVLCTSWAEGCSNALMEAMAADVPVVTSRTGLFWDWWDHRLGERVDNSQDVEDYLVALHTVLSNPTWYSPRTVVYERKLDCGSWALAWTRVIEEAVT